jgi:hypothetical protein
MLPYWLLFSLFAVGSVQFRERGSIFGRTAPLLPAAIIFTSLMIGLRYRVGADWSSYEELYAAFAYLEFGDALGLSDFGYAALNWLSNRLGLGIWFVNLVCGSIFGWGLLTFARQQPNPWLAIAIAVPYLVIVVAMGYTRQGVAIGLALAALAAFAEGSILRFLAFVLCAAAFHKTALILLPLAALGLGRKRAASTGLILILGAFLFYMFLGGSVDPLLRNYVAAEYSSQGAAIRIAMNLPPALIFLAYRNSFHVSDREGRLWTAFSLASFAALAFLLLTPSSTAVDRISLYLIPLQIFVLCRLPQAFRGRRTTHGQLTLAVIAYSAAIQFVWLNYAVHAGAWVPYKLYPATAVT